MTISRNFVHVMACLYQFFYKLHKFHINVRQGQQLPISHNAYKQTGALLSAIAPTKSFFSSISPSCSTPVIREKQKRNDCRPCCRPCNQLFVTIVLPNTLPNRRWRLVYQFKQKGCWQVSFSSRSFLLSLKWRWVFRYTR